MNKSYGPIKLVITEFDCSNKKLFLSNKLLLRFIESKYFNLSFNIVYQA
jgi:hypothetical protein